MLCYAMLCYFPLSHAVLMQLCVGLCYYFRYNPVLPQTDVMMSQYIDSRPAGPSYLFERFMVNASPDPVVHCVGDSCKGNTIATQGPKRHVRSKYPCPNGRVPILFYLQWQFPSRVPRAVVRADYELWCSGHPRFKDGSQASWDTQLKELLDRGLMRNKTPGGRANVSITVSGDIGQMQVQEQQTKAGGKTTTTKKDIFVKTSTWKESSVMAYEFPPLKEIWATMVNAGWIRPDEIMPIDEVANVAMELDTAEGDN